MILFMDFEFLLCFVKMKAYGNILHRMIKSLSWKERHLRNLTNRKGQHTDVCIYLHVSIFAFITNKML